MSRIAEVDPVRKQRVYVDADIVALDLLAIRGIGLGRKLGRVPPERGSRRHADRHGEVRRPGSEAKVPLRSWSRETRPANHAAVPLSEELSAVACAAGRRSLPLCARVRARAAAARADRAGRRRIRCRTPPNLASVSASGVGLHITRAPSECYEFLSELTSTELGENPATPARSPAPEEPIAPVEPAAAEPPVEAETQYRVPVKHASGPRSRTLSVEATSRERAELHVLDELGDEWKVIHVEVA